MRVRSLVVLVLFGGVVSACREGGPPAQQPAGSSPPAADGSCVVWGREVEFARSVKDHDAHAFAEHVHPGAVFVEGDGSVLRGRDAVVTSWASIIRGDDVHLEWYPTSVIQTGAAHDVALVRTGSLLDRGDQAGREAALPDGHISVRLGARHRRNVARAHGWRHAATRCGDRGRHRPVEGRSPRPVSWRRIGSGHRRTEDGSPWRRRT